MFEGELNQGIGSRQSYREKMISQWAEKNMRLAIVIAKNGHHIPVALGTRGQQAYVVYNI